MSSFALAYRNYLTEPGGVWIPPSIAMANNRDAAFDPRLAVVAWHPTYLELHREWSEPRTVHLISVLNHNIKPNQAAGSFVVFLTLDETVVWDSSTASASEWLPPSPLFLRNWIIPIPEGVVADGLKVESNQSIDGSPLFVGHLWAGPLWIPGDGVQSDWRHSVIDPGEMVISRGGQGYARLRQRRREVEVTLTDMDFENAFGNAEGTVLDLQQLGYYVGNTEPVIVLPRIRDQTGEPPWPIDPQMIHRLGVYGRLRDPLSIRHLGGDRYSSTLQVEELM